MKIKEIVDQSRRDFQAIYECEYCGFEHKGGGYDDANFHDNVIPAMECPESSKRAKDSYRPLTTKYKDHEVV